MRKYFSGNYVFSSPKSIEDQKQRSSPKIEKFLPPKPSEDLKKRFSPQFGTKFGRKLWNLFVLPGPFSSAQPALKPRWGTLNLDGGTLNLNGGNANSSWGDASPYNLSFEQDATSDGSIYG